MQGAMDQTSQACDNYDPITSTKRTAVVHTPASTWKAKQRTNNHCEWTKLQVVDKFTYLESTLSRVVHIDDEVTARTHHQCGFWQTSRKCLGVEWNQT